MNETSFYAMILTEALLKIKLLHELHKHPVCFVTTLNVYLLLEYDDITEMF